MRSFFSKVNEGNLKIGFLGLGKSNIGVLDYLKGKNFEFHLTLRSDKKLSESEGFNPEKVFEEQNALYSIDEDYLFLSPSVRRDRRELYLAEARGTVLTSDAELFFANTDKEIFAVTGSDGKSTTTFLISKMLSSEKEKYEPAANFGKSLTSFLSSDITPVAELSSFQLMYMKPKTKRAVITNITPNHLNWHTDIKEYIEAKKNIFSFSDGIIADVDSEILKENLPNKRLFCAVSEKFSLQNMLKLFKAENYMTRIGSMIYLNGLPFFDTRKAMRREGYNIKNYMLSAGACLGYAERTHIQNTVNVFSGLPHRAELVLTKNNVSYINSSIDSSPERTLKTLRAIADRYTVSSKNAPPVSVIIGGLGKGLDTGTLALELPSLTSGAVLLGSVGDEIYCHLKKNNARYNYTFAENMEDAVKLAESFLDDGGCVLLSPAATSFDHYKNFEERGEHFRRIVLNGISE